MKNLKLRAAVLCLSWQGLTIASITTVLSSIIEVFPGASESFVKSFVTGPSIMIVLFSILSGQMSVFLSRKSILYLGLALAMTGGIAPLFINNLYIIFALRLLLGAGCGILQPFSQGLITQCFEGEERNFILGFQSVVVSIGSMFVNWLSGMLGSGDWHNAFYVYFISVPIFFLIFLFLPEHKAVRNESRKIDHPKLPVTAYIIGLIMCVFNVFIYGFYANASFVVSEKGLGGALISGNILALYAGIGIVGGLLFGKIPEKKSRIIVPVFCLSCILGFLCMSLTDSLSGMLTGAGLLGLGFSVIMPYAVKRISHCVVPQLAILACSVLQVGSHIGVFLSPYIMLAIKNFFQISTYKSLFLFCAAGLVFLGAVVVGIEHKTKIKY